MNPKNSALPNEVDSAKYVPPAQGIRPAAVEQKLIHNKFYYNGEFEAVPAQRLLMLVDGSQDSLAQFVETITVASAIRRPGLEIEFAGPEEFLPMVMGTDLFERVHGFTKADLSAIHRLIKRKNYQGLYYSGRDLKIMTLGWLKGIQHRGGAAKSGLLRNWQLSTQAPAELSKMGVFLKPGAHQIQLEPDFNGFEFDTIRHTLSHLNEKPYLVLEPFSTDGSQVWPPEMVDRYLHLILKKTDLNVILLAGAMPQVRRRFSFDKGKDLAQKQLKKIHQKWQRLEDHSNGRLLLLDSLPLADKSLLYSEALCFVGSISSELLLAKLLGSQVIAFTDLLYHNHRKKDSVDFNRDNVVYLRPEYLSCIGDCAACAHPECISYISPERAFEALKVFI